MNEKTMKRISSWGRVLGVIMMITGALSALSGLLFFVVGAIPGAFSAFMGYLIFKTGKSAQQFLETESEESIYELLDEYAKYLFVQGILLIVTVAAMLLLFLLAGIGIFSAFM